MALSWCPSGFLPFFYQWHFKSDNASFLMRGHAVFDIYPQTKSNTIDCSSHSFSDSRVHRAAFQLTSWSQESSISRPCVVSSDRPGRILHYLLFTLYTGGQGKWWGTGERKCLDTAGGTHGSLFLDWSHPAIVGALPKSGIEVHRGRNQARRCTEQSAPVDQSWWRITSAKKKECQCDLCEPAGSRSTL